MRSVPYRGARLQLVSLRRPGRVRHGETPRATLPGHCRIPIFNGDNDVATYTRVESWDGRGYGRINGTTVGRVTSVTRAHGPTPPLVRFVTGTVEGLLFAIETSFIRAIRRNENFEYEMGIRLAREPREERTSILETTIIDSIGRSSGNCARSSQRN